MYFVLRDVFNKEVLRQGKEHGHYKTRLARLHGLAPSDTKLALCLSEVKRYQSGHETHFGARVFLS